MFSHNAILHKAIRMKNTDNCKQVFYKVISRQMNQMQKSIYFIILFLKSPKTSPNYLWWQARVITESVRGMTGTRQKLLDFQECFFIWSGYWLYNVFTLWKLIHYTFFYAVYIFYKLYRNENILKKIKIISRKLKIYRTY